VAEQLREGRDDQKILGVAARKQAGRGGALGHCAMSETYTLLSNLAAAGAAAVFLYLIFWG
jgi:hypothetical protein